MALPFLRRERDRVSQPPAPDLGSLPVIVVNAAQRGTFPRGRRGNGTARFQFQERMPYRLMVPEDT